MSSSVVSVSSSATAPPGTTFADVACFITSFRAACSAVCAASQVADASVGGSEATSASLAKMHKEQGTEEEETGGRLAEIAAAGGILPLVALGRCAEYDSGRQRAVHGAARSSAGSWQNFFIQVAETPGQRVLRPVVSEMERGSTSSSNLERHAPASRVHARQNLSLNARSRH